MSKRGTRTLEEEFQIYVQFLKDNNEFPAGKITAQNSEKFHKLWEDLTIQLNS